MHIPLESINQIDNTSMPIGEQGLGATSATESKTTTTSDDAGDTATATARNRGAFYYQIPVYRACMEPCMRCRRATTPAARQCVHMVFLISFVLFLVVGVALTCLGFLDYDTAGASSRAFRVLGIVALLLCIGFLIAACVILSECVTSAIKQPIDDEYGYQALFPSYSDSFSSGLGERVGTAVLANCGHPILIQDASHSNIAAQQQQNIRLGMQPISDKLCASCSCQLIGPITGSNLPASVSCPQSIVHFTKDGRVNVASEKTSETNSSYLMDIHSDDEDMAPDDDGEPREWV